MLGARAAVLGLVGGSLFVGAVSQRLNSRNVVFALSIVCVSEAFYFFRTKSSIPRLSRAQSLRARTTSEELIPRDVLFGNPEYASPTISPDGELLAYLRPADGVLNAWVRSVGKTDDRVVTNDRVRGIRGVSWAEDSKTLLFNQDEGGDENFHLYAIDATTPGAVAVDLTPYDGAKAQNVMTNKRYPEQLLVATNKRDPAAFDMYRIDLPKALAGDVLGATELDTVNPGDVVGWGAEDSSFEVRHAVVKNQADSSTTVRILESKGKDVHSNEWRDLITFPYGEDGRFVDFCADGESGLMLSTIGRDTTALLKISLENGETKEVIAANDKVILLC